jgi:hypothetical protein
MAKQPAKGASPPKAPSKPAPKPASSGTPKAPKKAK